MSWSWWMHQCVYLSRKMCETLILVIFQVIKVKDFKLFTAVKNDTYIYLDFICDQRIVIIIRQKVGSALFVLTVMASPIFQSFDLFFSFDLILPGFVFSRLLYVCSVYMYANAHLFVSD